VSALSAIFGLSGERLTDWERDFFRDSDPWGFILFKRNIDAPDQTRALCDSLRETVGRHAPIFIDQEGGPVARLRPPHWRDYPSAEPIGRLYAENAEAGLEACRLKHRLMADELLALGVNADWAPVLDLRVPGAHEVIAARAFAEDAAAITALGRAAIEGLHAGGVHSVLKHIPGHGRADADSHHALPVVDAPRKDLSTTDFAPFKDLADQSPMAMTAHILYRSIDEANPATLSASLISDVIRGEMGFDGLLMSDDLDMKALPGIRAARARNALAAGCDIILQCSGEADTMRVVAPQCRALSGDALRRAKAAETPPEPEAFDAEAGYARLKELVAWQSAVS